MNNMKFVKQIREETNCPLKDITEILEMFMKYEVIPERQDIVDVIRYKQIVAKSKNKGKSIEEYVKRFMKINIKGGTNMEETYLDRINAFFTDYKNLRKNRDIIANIDTDFFFDIMDDLKMYVENYNYTEEDIKKLLKEKCEIMDKLNDTLLENVKLRKGNEENDK